MSETEAELRKQRDALAWIVWQAWQFANQLWEVEPTHVEEWMLQKGLVEEAEATIEDCTPYNGLEPGEPMMRLTPFGKDSMIEAAKALSHG